jgi:hypothetical protein
MERLRLTQGVRRLSSPGWIATYVVDLELDMERLFRDASAALRNRNGWSSTTTVHDFRNLIQLDGCPVMTQQDRFAFAVNGAYVPAVSGRGGSGARTERATLSDFCTVGEWAKVDTASTSVAAKLALMQLCRNVQTFHAAVRQADSYQSMLEPLLAYIGSPRICHTTAYIAASLEIILITFHERMTAYVAITGADWKLEDGHEGVARILRDLCTQLVERLSSGLEDRYPYHMFWDNNQTYLGFKNAAPQPTTAVQRPREGDTNETKTASSPTKRPKLSKKGNGGRGNETAPYSPPAATVTPIRAATDVVKRLPTQTSSEELALLCIPDVKQKLGLAKDGCDRGVTCRFRHSNRASWKAEDFKAGNWPTIVARSSDLAKAIKAGGW